MTTSRRSRGTDLNADVADAWQIEETTEYAASADHRPDSLRGTLRTHRQAGEVAFDTEFLSEHNPIAPNVPSCNSPLASVRPRSPIRDVRDLSPWWKLMAARDHRRGPRRPRRGAVLPVECRCPARKALRRADRRRTPESQLSLNYNAIVGRVLNVRTHGKETRTDWRRRPLTDRQIAYAIEDVEHLLEIYTKQSQLLASRGRTPWPRPNSTA